MSRKLRVAPAYRPRFVSDEQLETLLLCWRLTSVGHHVTPGEYPGGNAFSRHSRLLRAVAMAERMNGGERIPGAYKDLDCSLGEHCGRITS